MAFNDATIITPWRDMDELIQVRHLLYPQGSHGEGDKQTLDSKLLGVRKVSLILPPCLSFSDIICPCSCNIPFGSLVTLSFSKAELGITLKPRKIVVASTIFFYINPMDKVITCLTCRHVVQSLFGSSLDIRILHPSKIPQVTHF
jgi:hypothetical protein